jgi:hypothetical protein
MGLESHKVSHASPKRLVKQVVGAGRQQSDPISQREIFCLELHSYQTAASTSRRFEACRQSPGMELTQLSSSTGKALNLTISYLILLLRLSRGKRLSYTAFALIFKLIWCDHLALVWPNS